MTPNQIDELKQELEQMIRQKCDTVDSAPPNLEYRTVHLKEPAMRTFIESL